MAEAVARQLAKGASPGGSWVFASAGTYPPRLAEPPDPRAQASLAARDYPSCRQRSRPVILADFYNFDLILAMDGLNLVHLQRFCPPGQTDKLSLLLDYDAHLRGTDIPDPYYGNAAGFEHVLDLCEAGARGLLRHYAL